MDLLPNDLKYAILVQLDWFELGQICVANKVFHQLGSNELYWKSKYLFDFGEPYMELTPAKAGYFNQYRYVYLQKVKDDLYQFIYNKIDEGDKKRFPKLFEKHLGDFDQKLVADINCFKNLLFEFFHDFIRPMGGGVIYRLKSLQNFKLTLDTELFVREAIDKLRLPTIE